ncbi:MAG: ABC transporter substrate-binding protein [Desulfomonilaceae bacterium]
MKTRITALLTLLVGILTLSGTITVSSAVASDTIRIGFVADATGIGAGVYKGQKNGIDLFIEEANAAGGVLGKKLELIVRDAQLKPDIGANMARELILSEKCDFLLGGTSSGVGIAITKVAGEFKKILVIHTCNSEALTTTDFQPYMFQVVPNTGMQGRAIALYLSQKPYKRFGYIGPDYTYGHTEWESFKSDLRKLKPDVKLLDPVWVKVGETSYASYIPILVGQNPDIVFSSLWGGGLSSFIKQATPYGLFKKSSITALFELDMLKAMGQSMPSGMLGFTRCPFYAIDTPEMKAFVQKYHDKYKEYPSDWACLAYDGMLVLAQAIKKANSLDSEEVVKVIGGLKFKSLQGDRYIRTEDHMANVGVYVGYTAKDPKYKDFLIMKDVVEVPAEKVWLSVGEVKKLQSEKK